MGAHIVLFIIRETDLALWHFFMEIMTGKTLVLASVQQISDDV